MIQNYCYVGKNKIYAEIYDELLEEELSMFKQEHQHTIKDYIKKKINNEKYIGISDTYDMSIGNVGSDDIISDLILKITKDAGTTDLQGNTILMFANPNEMYEIFHMENLVKSFSDLELNEFGSISNIQMEPIYWGCGIFKTTYDKGELKGSIITKNDVANLFVQNYYHMGVMIGCDPNNYTEIDFSGEDPYKVIGQNFIQSNVTDVIGFNLMPFVEKDSKEQNLQASKLFGREIKGRVFVTLLCPQTQKKYWNITMCTIKDIVKILSNNELATRINKLLESDENISKSQNPFYYVKKVLCE